MDFKNGKVKQVQPTGMFQDLYKFEVTMEDGTAGIMYKKADNPFLNQGDEVNYTLSPKGTFKVIPAEGGKWSNKKSGATGTNKDVDVQELIVRQNSVTNAVAYCKGSNCSPEEVTGYAQIFRDWIFSEQGDTDPDTY